MCGKGGAGRKLLQVFGRVKLLGVIANTERQAREHRDHAGYHAAQEDAADEDFDELHHVVGRRGGGSV